MKTISYREIETHIGWENIQRYANNGRRSGRSKLIIAKAINELLSSGCCLIVEHEGSPQTIQYYEKFTQYWFYKALQGFFYDIPIKELQSLFPVRFILDDGYCLGIWVLAKEEEQYQYNTGYEPHFLKEEIKELKSDLKWWQDKHQGCVNLIERLRGSFWAYICFRLKF